MRRWKLTGFNFVRRSRVTLDGVSVPWKWVSPDGIEVTIGADLLKRLRILHHDVDTVPAASEDRRRCVTSNSVRADPFPRHRNAVEGHTRAAHEIETGELHAPPPHRLPWPNSD